MPKWVVMAERLTALDPRKFSRQKKTWQPDRDRQTASAVQCRQTDMRDELFPLRCLVQVGLYWTVLDCNAASRGDQVWPQPVCLSATLLAVSDVDKLSEKESVGKTVYCTCAPVSAVISPCFLPEQSSFHDHHLPLLRRHCHFNTTTSIFCLPLFSLPLSLSPTVTFPLLFLTFRFYTPPFQFPHSVPRSYASFTNSFSLAIHLGTLSSAKNTPLGFTLTHLPADGVQSRERAPPFHLHS